MITTLAVGSNQITTVSMPTSPGIRSVEWSFVDSVAVVTSPFTGQTQTQAWPGADQWMGTVTLPPLTYDQADHWVSFLMECRGMLNGFLMGDPSRTSNKGLPHGAPVPDLSNSAVNIAGTDVLYTQGWQASTNFLLRPGDLMQVGYRLHKVLETVASDGSGKAQISIWPSLREAPTANPIILSKPQGLFRLATNRRTVNVDYTRLTKLSFQIMEYR